MQNSKITTNECDPIQGTQTGLCCQFKVAKADSEQPVQENI